MSSGNRRSASLGRQREEPSLEGELGRPRRPEEASQGLFPSCSCPGEGRMALTRAAGREASGESNRVCCGARQRCGGTRGVWVPPRDPLSTRVSGGSVHGGRELGGGKGIEGNQEFSSGQRTSRTNKK